MTHCQICVRAVAARRAGTISHHHVRGEACLGVGFLPLEQSDSRLAEIADQAQREAASLSRSIADLHRGRANRIKPELIQQASSASLRSEKLARRLRRHRAWPARFARQLETQGWGDPPSVYLLSL